MCACLRTCARVVGVEREIASSQKPQSASDIWAREKRTESIIHWVSPIEFRLWLDSLTELLFRFLLRCALASDELLVEAPYPEVNLEEALGNNDDSRVYFTSKSLRSASCRAASNPTDLSGRIQRDIRDEFRFHSIVTLGGEYFISDALSACALNLNFQSQNTCEKRASTKPNKVERGRSYLLRDERLLESLQRFSSIIPLVAAAF